MDFCHIVRLPDVDSTMAEVQRRAVAGAKEGLVVVADRQTQGRGRRGRPFQSLPGKGLYLSCLLRPTLDPQQLPQLTAWTAVAVCRALEEVADLTLGIKWTNDIILNRRKLGGILTELVFTPKPAVIVGIGLNLTQTKADFGPALADLATSLAQEGATPDKAALLTTLLEHLGRMYRDFPAAQGDYLSAYRARCLTTGHPVLLHRENGVKAQVYAEEISDDFTLTVRHPNGQRETVTAGEVSVRGLLNYVDGGTTMEASHRRTALLDCLRTAQQPLSGAVLAQRFGVSRQRVLGDIALLRAGGAPIEATARGYLIAPEDAGALRTITCRHAADELEAELNLLVDQGCTVVDVSVEHPVYGVLTGGLNLTSRFDVELYLKQVETAQAAPLSLLTGGVHLHTLRCPSEAVYHRAVNALSQAGFLVEDDGKA